MWNFVWDLLQGISGVLAWIGLWNPNKPINLNPNPSNIDDFSRFQDDDYKNWLKTTCVLRRLNKSLGSFLETETEIYHRSLCDKMYLILKGAECQTKCTIEKGSKRNQVPTVCNVCEPWRDEIRQNHTHKFGQVHWENCTPHLWPKEKWEVAKVYMSRGCGKLRTVDEFDIPAFLNLMTFCKHFKKFVNNTLISKVRNVRNQVYHSADHSVQKADLEQHLQHIKQLADFMEERAPSMFDGLTKYIDQLQNTDFNLTAYVRTQLQSWSPGAPEFDPYYMMIGRWEACEFLREEQQVLEDWMENLARRCEDDRENALTKEELQGVRVFLEGNPDLDMKLAPQWKRLTEVHERVELHGLTDRVETLEQDTDLRKVRSC